MAKELTPFDYAKNALTDEALKHQIALALPKHLTPDRALRIALTAALNNPKIGEACKTSAGKASLYKALLTASQLGLEVDGRQGHLVPFKDKNLGLIIQFIPGYQGLIGLAYNHPKVKAIWAEAVYAKDYFVYKLGLNRTLEHTPFDGDDRGELTHAYAVAELEGGAKAFVCQTRREIMKAKASSRGADNEFSPWKTHEPQMWVKTAVRQLAKFIPQSTELRSALEVEDTGFDEPETPKHQKPTLDVKVESVEYPAETEGSRMAKDVRREVSAENLKKASDETRTKMSQATDEEKKKAEEKARKELEKEKARKDEKWIREKAAIEDGATVTAGHMPEETNPAMVSGLRFFLDAAGVSFEDFRGWLVSTGHDLNAVNYQAWDQIPAELCKKLMETKVHLEKAVKLYGTPKPGTASQPF